ncbi:MAG: alpha/beta hydrolase [Beijerinckiaceae bacterium]
MAATQGTAQETLLAAVRTKSKILRRALWGALLFCAAIYIFICGYMFFAQRSLQYRPDPARADPGQSGLPSAQEITLQATDGETLVAWWLAPRDASAPVYLYFHGNAGNLARRAGRFERLSRHGAGVFAVAYRGYSGSTGTPSEAGFYRDANAAYAWLTQKIPGQRVIAFGESIGTGVAVQIASDNNVRALVLDAPYSSTADVARHRYPWLPISILMRDQFRSDLRAPSIKVPVFIAHCTGDRTIPLEFGEALAQLFKSPLQLHKIDAVCHPAPYDRFIGPMEQFIMRHKPA